MCPLETGTTFVHLTLFPSAGIKSNGVSSFELRINLFTCSWGIFRKKKHIYSFYQSIIGTRQGIVRVTDPCLTLVIDPCNTSSEQV
jgi:hypothetical protein